MATQVLPKGVRQRGNTFLVDVTYKGKRETATVGSVDEAIVKKQELKLALMTGKIGREVGAKTGKQWTVGEAFDYTKTHVWSGTRGEITASRNAEGAVSHFGRTYPLASITLEGLDEWVEKLKAMGNSDGTINRKLAALSKVMSVAVDRQRLTSKPKFPRRKEAKGRIRFLSGDEEKQGFGLLAQWGKDDERDAFVVLIDTGLRVGELLRLTPQDVDGKMLSIWETKADLPRSVPMTTRVQAIIERRLKGLTRVDKVFTQDHHALRHTWDRMRAAMGLAKDPQFVPHALRHTCASRLVQRGVSLKVVQEWLGHRTMTVTMRYAHLCPTNLVAAAAVLEGDQA